MKMQEGGHSLITENPVKRLSQTRAWYRVERRNNFIKAHELSAWYKEVIQLENETLRDYLLLILFECFDWWENITHLYSQCLGYSYQI